MSEFKGTPGPWKATHVRGNNFAVQEFEIRGTLFGNQGKAPIFSKDASAIDGTHIFVSPEDASLICAAPELLEALRLCYDHCRLYYPEVEHNNVGKAVRAAIAKATGAA